MANEQTKHTPHRHDPEQQDPAAAPVALAPGPENQDPPYALGKGSTPDPDLDLNARTWRDKKQPPPAP